MKTVILFHLGLSLILKKNNHSHFSFLSLLCYDYRSFYHKNCFALCSSDYSLLSLDYKTPCQVLNATPRKCLSRAERSFLPCKLHLLKKFYVLFSCKWQHINFVILIMPSNILPLTTSFGSSTNLTVTTEWCVFLQVYEQRTFFILDCEVDLLEMVLYWEATTNHCWWCLESEH